MPHVAVVANESPVPNLRDPGRRGPVHRAFVQRLRERGWIEGQSIAFDWRSAEGRAEPYPDIMAELVRLKVDAILTGSTLVVGQEVAGKHLQLLKEVAPAVSRVAVIGGSPSIASSLAWRRETEVSARALGPTLLWITLDRREQLADVLPAVTTGRADALLVQGTATNFSHRARLVARPRLGCQPCTGIQRRRGRAD